MLPNRPNVTGRLSRSTSFNFMGQCLRQMTEQCIPMLNHMFKHEHRACHMSPSERVMYNHTLLVYLSSRVKVDIKIVDLNLGVSHVSTPPIRLNDFEGGSSQNSSNQICRAVAKGENWHTSYRYEYN